MRLHITADIPNSEMPLRVSINGEYIFEKKRLDILALGIQRFCQEAMIRGVNPKDLKVRITLEGQESVPEIGRRIPRKRFALGKSLFDTKEQALDAACTGVGDRVIEVTLEE